MNFTDQFKSWLENRRAFDQNGTLKTRLAICHECSFKLGPICGQCGCVLSLKALLINSHCPILKW